MAGLRGRIQRSELGDALGKLRGGLGGIALLSAVLNVLTLAGSIYLMLVYDRVLPGESVPTLVSLFIMVGLAYAFHGMFDVMRSKMLADVAATLDRRLTARVQLIETKLALERPDARERMSPTRDLDQLRTFIASPGVPALIDLPWIFFFLIILTLVHYWLGIVTLIGAIVLAILALVAERVSTKHVAAVGEAAAHRRILGERHWRHAELISSLGMRGRLMRQWEGAHHKLLDEQAKLTDTTSTLSGLSRVFRMFLQSMVLTVGALLVIDGKATGGVIFASSILSGRALAPVDMAIAHWRGFVGARQAWARLNTLLAQPGGIEERTELPPPTQAVAIDKLTLVPPGSQRATVADVSFAAKAGEAVGIIGPSASGKSSLVRGVIGAWKPARGTVRLDGATIDQWDSEALGPHIGYLPQSVELFAGTVAENIARFEPNAPSDTVIAAATAAGVHQLILLLPDGYDTQVGEEGTNLSAGQRQRIALARAMFRDPFLVVLDEPNSNLDPEGDAALAQAILSVKKRKGIVLLVAHRPQILGLVEHVLLLRGGTMQAFGPRDEVLAKLAPPPAPSAPKRNDGLTVVPKRS
ncbi:MAG: type I secretion system permease/ATPase [Sphingomonadales bacterium]|nr:MAG: type I secretion system permease/ATPase [Sphingomonadales bacterium]